MNLWNNILDNSNATITDNGIVSFADNPDETANHELLVVPLINKDILSISGPDSKKFLQGQATCNLDELSDNSWTPGAICDPKGRMITSFSLYQCTADLLLLEMAEGLAEVTLTTIDKYSAFFKANLEDITSNYGLIGLMGPKAKQTLEQLLGVTLKGSPEFIQHNDCLISCFDDGRIKLIIPEEQLEGLWQSLCEAGTACSNRHWHMADIQQGIGEVSMATTGEFIPQMINLQARNGISFKKGCYTGQEIVARMKYLGKLKRRMYRLHLKGSTLPEAGEPCFTGEKASSQGTVVSTAQINDHMEALVIMTEQLAGAAQVGIGQQPHQSFDSLPLPYSLD